MFNNNIGGQNFDRFKAQSSFKDGSLGNKYLKKKKKKEEDDENLFDEDDDNSARYSDEGFSLEDMLGEDFDKNDNNTFYDTRSANVPKKDDDEPPTENFFQTGL
ncbi:hypothetical protein IJI31_04330 [bacterium]|nr:hypothetical protein [bacterium]